MAQAAFLLLARACLRMPSRFTRVFPVQRPLGREHCYLPLLTADVAEVAVVSVQRYDGRWPCTLSINFRKGPVADSGEAR